VDGRDKPGHDGRGSERSRRLVSIAMAREGKCRADQKTSAYVATP
jgi:hypothetical protein